MQAVIIDEKLLSAQAREVASRMGASTRFKKYERALEHFQSDPSASALMESMGEVQKKASREILPWGESNEWNKKLDELNEQVRNHPTIQNLRKAESQLVDLLLSFALRLGDLTAIDYAEACTGRGLNGCGPSRIPQEVKTLVAESVELEGAVGELGRIITQTAEYRKFERARKSFETDPGLCEIRKEMKEVRSRYLKAERDGRLTVEQIDQVRSAQGRLQDHPVVKLFFRERQEMEKIIQSVNRIVSDNLGIDVAGTLAPTGGCCG
jgi:cell fate (sporulation/competence/biofilm development) regulator YlbF (YheA/YmcA/DUF963 family)